MASPMPAAEVEIDEDLVRRLLESQFPQWASLPVRPTSAVGWDNAIYRLGPHLAVRLPRRRMAAELVDAEHRWLPDFAPRVPVAIPVPIGRGRPDEGFPWKWTVCRWIPGEMAATAERVDPDAMAADLGAFVAAMHVPAPVDAATNPWRGVPLASRDHATRERIDHLGDAIDTVSTLEAWTEATHLAPWAGPALWLHGDLHPANIIVEDGRLSGVIDFGDMCAGDPATDLISAWLLLPPPSRSRFQEAAEVDDATWARGRGWALALSLVYLAESADNPVLASIGRHGLDEVLVDLG